jgi:hypothetical protein
MYISLRRPSGRRSHHVVAATVAALAFGLLPVNASAATPVVVPPDQPVAGKTSGEWSAEWWRQVLAIPAAHNPLFQEGQVECNLGASGVVFLVGNFGGTSKRSCSVPSGSHIFLPAVNGECSHAEGNGDTEAELRSCANAQADLITSTTASVDGRRVGPSRSESPLFSFNLPPDNVFGLPPQTSRAVADGYWVMLAPLQAGDHRISFGGAAKELRFSTSTTYIVRVG